MEYASLWIPQRIVIDMNSQHVLYMSVFKSSAFEESFMNINPKLKSNYSGKK